jgi:hypothetical protein
MNILPNGRAFISCSLRSEDMAFVGLIEKIVKAHHLIPFGTVGKYSAAPLNPAILMNQNIPLSDIIVIAATPRYFQRDVQTGKITSGISEMLHVEAGIAYASNKPIIVFVKQGTSAGNFLPNVTQYITLDGSKENLTRQWGLINSLFDNAILIANQNRQKKSLNGLKKVLIGGLAVLGGASLFDSGSDYEED